MDLRIEREDWNETILFRVDEGQLSVVLESITKEGEYQDEDVFNLDFQELLRLRDLLNKYAPPNTWKVKCQVCKNEIDESNSSENIGYCQSCVQKEADRLLSLIKQ